MQGSSVARTCPVVVVDTGGVAEDADVDIQPITRADFVPAKVFRSRSMNTRAARSLRHSKMCLTLSTTTTTPSVIDA